MQPHAAGWFAKIFDGKKSTPCVIVDFDEWRRASIDFGAKQSVP